MKRGGVSVEERREGVGGEADQQTGNRAPCATLQVMMSLFITFVNCFWMPWGGGGGEEVQTLN